MLLLLGLVTVTSGLRGGQLDQTSTEVYKNVTTFSIILGTLVSALANPTVGILY